MSDFERCRICDKEMLPNPNGICTECQRALGVTEGALPSPRPARPCARCGHGLLIRCSVQDRLGTGASALSQMAPLAVTYERGLVAVDRGEDVGSPMGILQAYICRSCGFVDWYATAPEQIPIGPKYGTELVDCSQAEGGPYR